MADDSFEGQDFDTAPRFEGQDFDTLAQQQAAPSGNAGYEGQDFDSAPKFEGQDFDSLVKEHAGEAESGPRTALRTGANAVIPGGAGLAGMYAGAAIGSPGGIPGALVGGLIGGVASSIAARYAQEKVKEAVGLDDSKQVALNEEEHPYWALGGELAGGAVGLSPVSAGTTMAEKLAQHGAGALLMGGFEAGSQALGDAPMSPGKIAMAAGAGAALPGVNKLGEKIGQVGERAAGAIGRRIPGRPGKVEIDPDAAQAHADVKDPEPVDLEKSSLAAEEPVPPSTEAQPTVGHGVGEGSERTYTKQPVAAAPKEDMLTQGQIRPEIEAALKDETAPAEVGAQPSAPEGHAPAPAEVGAQPQAVPPAPPAPVPQPRPVLRMPSRESAPAPTGNEAPTQRSRLPEPSKYPPGAGDQNLREAEDAIKALQAGPQDKGSELRLQQAEKMRDLIVAERSRVDELSTQPDATFPKAGDPLAVGENEATKYPEIKGRTPDNDSISSAQKEANNYPHARGWDFGKPFKIETHAGDMRRSKHTDPERWEVKSPYEYGYLGKTVSSDKEAIDLIMPKHKSPEQGGKHFVIDQKDLRTGKFDEPKVMTYVKDEATARDLYNRGFSDGKGADRLGGITEVTREDLTHYGQRHTTRPVTKEYAKEHPEIVKMRKVQPAADTVAVTPERKTLSLPSKEQQLRASNAGAEAARNKAGVERAPIKALIEKKLAEGDVATVEKIKAMPNEKLVEVAKDPANRVRKETETLVKTGKSVGVPVKGLAHPDGRPVTAGSKKIAEFRGNRHAQVEDWFEKSKPPSQLKPDDETNAEILTRLGKLPGPITDDLWRPRARPASWFLGAAAKEVMQKPTPANWKTFREAERLLRGAPEDVENYRATVRAEADARFSRRSGDDAVNNAEAKIASSEARNLVEDDLIESIDAKKAAERVAKIDEREGGKFDVPHEEAENEALRKPVLSKKDLRVENDRTVDVHNSTLADAPKFNPKTEAAAKRRAEADALVAAGKAKRAEEKARIEEARVAQEEAAKAAEEARAATEKEAASNKPITATVKEINVKEPTIPTHSQDGKEIPLVGTDRHAQLMADMEKALARNNRAKSDFDVTAAVDKGALARFGDDTTGSLNIKKIGADIEALLSRVANIQLPRGWLTAPKGSRWSLETTEHADSFARPARTDEEKLSRMVQSELQKTLGETKIAVGRELNWVKSLPKELSDKTIKEQIYRARDADSANVALPGKQPGKTNVESLPPDVYKLYKDHLHDGFEQNDKLLAAVRAVDPLRVGADVDHHMMRITKGKGNRDILLPEDDPTAPGQNGMLVNAATAMDRKYYALEDVATGKRHVISTNPEGGGFTKWDKFKAEAITAPKFAFKDGDVFTAGKNQFIMRQAMTEEIEKNARGPTKGSMQYYHNPAFSSAMTRMQLEIMAKNLQKLHDLSKLPAFEAMTSKIAKNGPEGEWKQSRLANFKGTHFHPVLREVLDDYAGKEADALSRLNQRITRLLFWMPTAHLFNVMHHWVVGRGWDNFTPMGIASLAITTPKAIMSVLRQDSTQEELMRLGAGLIWPSVRNRNAKEKIATSLGEEVRNNKSTYGPLADHLGVPLKDLGDSVYNASSHVMWAGNDMFITQRYMELRRKGISPEQAIIQVERDIPSYKMLSRLFTDKPVGRTVQEYLTEKGGFVTFARYHNNMMTAYTNMLKDVFHKDSTLGDRVEGVGKLLALGMLGMVFFPAMDMLQKKMTGNEGASQQRRGPMSVPHAFGEMKEGETDIAAPIRTMLSISPMYTTLLETLFNRDFRGKPIVEPGTVKKAFDGDGKAAGLAATQAAGHAIRGLISPVNTLSNAAKKDIGPLGAIRDAATDAKDPSQKANKFKALLPMHHQRDTMQRARAGGSDILESAYYKVFGR